MLFRSEFGRALGRLLLPGETGAALTQLIDGGAKIGATIEVVLESDDPEWLSLPLEALRLPDRSRHRRPTGRSSRRRARRRHWRAATAAP